jgi:transcriptional regulator with PAS, ATPase and Fis domain
VTERKRHPDVVYEPIMRSQSMKKLDEILRAVAPKEVTLTFMGESGTGKELLARRAHELSARKKGPFVPINCAAIPENLFESELFGHEKGAFTGAVGSRGKIETAQRGTLFLDEVGELPMSLQAKLLRFLENRRYMRVGGAAKIEADVRLMCATLRPLEQDVASGRFRADLYYRIQGITLQVPALRERRADIAPLLHHFTAQLSARHGVKPPRLTRQVRRLLLQYDWPGNVRELKNVVETLCLLRDGRQARVADLPPRLRIATSHGPLHAVPDAASPELTLRFDGGLDAMVHKIVETALAMEGGNVARAAARLKISSRTVQRQLAAGQVHLPPKGTREHRAP